jgi:hypothetical protein
MYYLPSIRRPERIPPACNFPRSYTKPDTIKSPLPPSGTSIPSPRTHLRQQHTNTLGPPPLFHAHTLFPESQSTRIPSRVGQPNSYTRSDRPLISQFRTPSRRRGAGARHAFCVHGMGPRCMWRKLPYVSIHESVWTCLSNYKQNTVVVAIRFVNDGEYVFVRGN